ncbi:hypothetical protein C4571_00180 [Candidatus Parcubacteria bacterium]|nr:MAG: hypothetical protein C4571_00180 [Candidatus Parcubacteria bacterium]
MKSPLRFSANVLEELRNAVRTGKPAISTEQGNLFMLLSLPLGAIKLNIPAEKYLSYIESLPSPLRPRPAHLFPSEEKDFEIIVNAAIECLGGKTFINGKEVKLL